jgi:hypothetical protein
MIKVEPYGLPNPEASIDSPAWTVATVPSCSSGLSDRQEEETLLPFERLGKAWFGILQANQCQIYSDTECFLSCMWKYHRQHLDSPQCAKFEQYAAQIENVGFVIIRLTGNQFL